MSQPRKTTSAPKRLTASRITSPREEGRPAGQSEPQDRVSLKRFRLRCGRRRSGALGSNRPLPRWPPGFTEGEGRSRRTKSGWKGFPPGACAAPWLPESSSSVFSTDERSPLKSGSMYQSPLRPFAQALSGRAGGKMLRHAPAFLPQDRRRAFV